MLGPFAYINGCLAWKPTASVKAGVDQVRCKVRKCKASKFSQRTKDTPTKSKGRARTSGTAGRQITTQTLSEPLAQPQPSTRLPRLRRAPSKLSLRRSSETQASERADRPSAPRRQNKRAVRRPAFTEHLDSDGSRASIEAEEPATGDDRSSIVREGGVEFSILKSDGEPPATGKHDSADPPQPFVLHESAKATRTQDLRHEQRTISRRDSTNLMKSNTQPPPRPTKSKSRARDDNYNIKICSISWPTGRAPSSPPLSNTPSWPHDGQLPTSRALRAKTPFDMSATVILSPPKNHRKVAPALIWASPVPSCSRPRIIWGYAKRWQCCRCHIDGCVEGQLFPACTIVEQSVCSNLACQHRRCAAKCQLLFC